jgi:hypothetical protein
MIIGPSNSASRYILKRLNVESQRAMCIPSFTIAIFTIATMWQQSNVEAKCNGALSRLGTERCPDILQLDEPRVRYTPEINWALSMDSV